MLRRYSENFRISLLPDAPEVAEMHEMLQMFLNYDIHLCFINRQYNENRIQTLDVSLTVHRAVGCVSVLWNTARVKQYNTNRTQPTAPRQTNDL
jgi:hypothetical protein